MTQAEQDVRAYCELVRTATLRTRAEGFNYSSMEDFLLDRAQFWTPAPLPKDVRQGIPKYCFWNALKLAQRRRKSLRYVEGVALHMIPTHHAWCVTADGQVVDPTWAEPGSAYFGVAFELGERLLSDGPVLADYRHGFPVFRWPRLNSTPPAVADGFKSLVAAAGVSDGRI